MEILVAIAIISLFGFAAGFMAGTLYALRSIRMAIDGTKRVRR